MNPPKARTSSKLDRVDICIERRILTWTQFARRHAQDSQCATRPSPRGGVDGIYYNDPGKRGKTAVETAWKVSKWLRWSSPARYRFEQRLQSDLIARASTSLTATRSRSPRHACLRDSPTSLPKTSPSTRRAGKNCSSTSEAIRLNSPSTSRLASDTLRSLSACCTHPRHRAPRRTRSGADRQPSSRCRRSSQDSRLQGLNFAPNRCPVQRIALEGTSRGLRGLDEHSTLRGFACRAAPSRTACPQPSTPMSADLCQTAGLFAKSLNTCACFGSMRVQTARRLA